MHLAKATATGSTWSHRALPAVLAAVSLGIASPAIAATILLSNASDNETVDFADLSATVEVEAAGDTLTVSVSNTSTSFDILRVYFNAASHVSGLSLGSGPTGWRLDALGAKGKPTNAGLFGEFDYVVWVKGKDAKDNKLLPGEDATFVVQIDGTGPYSAADFASVTSDVDAGEIAAFAAARFDGETSVTGAAHAPEPSTGLLVGMGACLMAARQRRRTSRRVARRDPR